MSALDNIFVPTSIKLLLVKNFNASTLNKTIVLTSIWNSCVIKTRIKCNSQMYYSNGKTLSR